MSEPAVDKPLQPLAYGKVDAPHGQHLATSALSFNETVVRLKRALQDQDLWLIHEIDPRMLLRLGGYDIPATRQLLFFHPRYMARLLSAVPAAIVEAPLKLVVMQTPAGSDTQAGAVCVRCPDPRALFGRYNGLAALGEELSSLCIRLLNTVACESDVRINPHSQSIISCTGNPLSPLD